MTRFDLLYRAICAQKMVDGILVRSSGHPDFYEYSAKALFVVHCGATVRREYIGVGSTPEEALHDLAGELDVVLEGVLHHAG